MADLVKALVGTGKAATDLVAAVLILIGGLLIMGALVFWVFIHPEWSFDEALMALWPFLAAGSISIVLGWLVDRVETASVAARDRRRAMSSRDTHPIG
jgi:predicted lysophospholipase L1 biosynthesis ABC-type transport system permease subunit